MQSTLRTSRAFTTFAGIAVAFGLFLALGGTAQQIFRSDGQSLAAPPENPTSISVAAVCDGTTSVILVGWSDVVDSTSYRVFRNGSQIATTSASEYEDRSVNGGTTYSYTVQACNADGCAAGTSQSATTTAQFCATPNNPPVCPTVTASPSSGQAPLNVNFTANASDPDGDPITIIWQFGDGASANDDNTTSHTYTTPGTYTVRANVADNRGGTVICSTTVTVTGFSTIPPSTITPQPPENPTSISVAAVCDGTTSVILVGWSDVVDSTSYRVFRNGSQIATTSASEYEDRSVNGGTTYSYTVQACNADGCAAGTSQSATTTAQFCATPNNPPVCPTVTASPSSGQAPLNVNFTANASDPDGDPITIIWQFGDGASANDDNTTSHTYTTPGTYTVRANVADNRGGTVICSTTVTVTGFSTIPPENNPPVCPTVTASPSSGLAPLTVNFVATASDPDGDSLAYTWNFGNGSQVVTGANASTRYDNPGTYSISVTVSDGRATAVCSTTVVVHPPSTVPPQNNPPVCPTVTASPSSGQAPLNVNFTANASDPDGDVLTATWNFGDGQSTTNGLTVSHTYTAAGTFTATATVSDGRNPAVTCSVPVSVTQVPPGNPNFTIDKSVTPTVADDGDEVRYTITVRNIGTASGDVIVTDTIGFSSRGYIVGSEGGRLTYVSGSQAVSGASASGTINTADGIRLTNVAANSTVTITYRGRIDADDLDDETTRFLNAACLSTGGCANARVDVNVEGDEDATIEKSASPTTLRADDIVTYTLRIRNTGDAEIGSLRVVDTISGRDTITGSNGGSIRYIRGSMRSSGGRVSGDIGDSSGVRITDLGDNDVVTITYQARADVTGMSGSSTVRNRACIDLGDCAEANVILVAAGVIPPAPPTPTPQPPVYIPPRPPVIHPPIVVLPPITPRNGFGDVGGIIFGAMGLAGTGTAWLRKKYLGHF